MDAPARPDRLERITLESSLEQLSDLLHWFERFNEPPLPPEIWIQGQTGLVEAFSNAVRHAHRPLQPKPPVEVSVTLHSDAIRIDVFDRGLPYDLDGALEIVRALVTAPDFDPLDREAHWGQVLMLRLRDQHGWQISYVCSEGGGNQFCLAHALGPSAAEGSGQ